MYYVRGYIFVVVGELTNCIDRLLADNALLQWGFPALTAVIGHLLTRKLLCYSWLNATYMAAHININQMSL